MVKESAAVIGLASNSVESTQAIAGAFANHVVSGDVLVLSGDLGAGKTAFTQGFGAALGVTERITSPTFTLVHEYEGRLPVHHVDVYRLTSADELIDLALPEMFDKEGVTVIEWGDLILPELPRDYAQLKISLGELALGPDSRRIDVTFSGHSWGVRSVELAGALGPWIDGGASC